MEKMTVEARLENCQHIFCKDCILNWATQNKNECPLCKTKFNKIKSKNKEIEIEDKTQEDEES